MAPQSLPILTEEEYLALDRANDFRSEFIDGEMLAMSGGPGRHSLLKVRLTTQFSIALSESDCLVFDSDMRLRIAASGSYVYPDMAVTCARPLFHGNKSDILTNPILLAEVLSPSTENYDKGKKFDLYRQIPSLSEYLLVSSDQAKIICFSRQPDNSWNLRETTGVASSLHIPALSIQLHLNDVYGKLLELPW